MIYLMLLVCMSITIQAASTKIVEIVGQNLFTQNTGRVFDAKIAQGYTAIEQSDRDAVDSSVGKIYQRFTVCKLNTLAQRCPLLVTQAQEQELILLQQEAIQENYHVAQQSLQNDDPLDERIEHWNAFRFSFDAAHRISTQRKITGIEIKTTPYETMIANEYLPLTEEQQQLFVVSLLVTACNWTRIDTADTAAFAEIFKDTLNLPPDLGIVISGEQRPVQRKPWLRWPSWASLPSWSGKK